METDSNGLARKRRIGGDGIVRYALTAVASVTVLIIFFIFLFIFLNSTEAISSVGLIEFLTGSVWEPLSGSFGAMPVITGTVLVTIGSIAIALPLGLGAAIFISEVAPANARNVLKPLCEVFAGIPSVVYGFFGLVVLLPLLRAVFPEQLLFGSSWLAGSILLGIMALPTIISVSEDALRAVPLSYREASVAMGATRWETTRKVVVPAAISGISAAAILGIGRAIGETMAVMMVSGNAAIFPDPLWDVFSLVRTITATLALEMPEVVVGSVHYSSLFLLALILMVMVFVVNYAARVLVRRTRRRFGGEQTAGRLSLPGMRDLLGARTAARVRSGTALTVLFAASAMAASLFTGPYLTFGSAAAVTVAAVTVGKAARRLSPAIRQKAAHMSLLAVMILVLALLAVIIGDIVIKGLPAISLEFIFGFPRDGGTSGGIYPALVGTLKLVAGTALIALPLGIASGVYLAEYARDTRATRIIGGALDVLNGTPSVVFGLFGLVAVVGMLLSGLTTGYSLLAGCITLAMMVLPVIIRTTEEAVSAVPHDLREASLAMGATKWQTVARVVLPAALGGIMTGTILSLGRAAGETAPIMFTAAVAFQSSIPGSVLSPVMALPYHLYYLSSEVPGSQTMQYGTALVLLMVVLVMFAAASVIRRRSEKGVRW